MKKLVILGVIMAFAHFAQAQTAIGNQTLGLNLQFNRSTSSGASVNPYDNSVTYTDQKYTAFTIGPNYSYFIADNLDLGTSLSYMYNKSDNGEGYSPVKSVGHTYGGSVFLRKYVMYQNKVGIRTGPYAGYSHSTVESTNPGVNAIYDFNSKTNNYYGGVNLELLFYPVKQMGVSLMLANLYYNHHTTDNGSQGKNKGNDLYASFINNGVGLSVFCVFGK